MDSLINETMEQRGYDLGYWIGVHLWWAMLLAVVVGVVFLFRARRRQQRLREHQRLLQKPHSSRS